MLNAHLRDSNAQVKTPSESSLREEDEGNHGTLVSRRYKAEQRAKDDHDKHRSSELPLPVAKLTAKEREQNRTEEDSEALWQGQNHSIFPVRAAIRVEDIDHLRPENAGRVVEHVDNTQCNDGSSEVPAPRADENVSWREWVFELAEMLPQGEADQHRGSDYQRCHDMGIIGLVYARPDDTHEERNRATDEEECAKVVERLESLLV